MMYDREKLHQAGQALYGLGWIESLSEGLNINLRTVQRWATGKMEIPPGIWPDVAALCVCRIREIEALAAELKRDGITPTE